MRTSKTKKQTPLPGGLLSVYETAQAGGETIYDALRQAGFIKSPGEFLPWLSEPLPMSNAVIPERADGTK